MNYKAVIFDMDGTVLNKIEDLTDSVNYIMRKFDLPEKTLDKVQHSVGSGAAVLMERILPDGRDNERFDEILDAYKAYLKKRGYKMAIVSNKSMGAVKELRDLYFKDYVDVAIGVAEGLERKPAPDECLEAIKQLGVSKEECIYVGDSEIDHLTAVNTGLKCISCLWGFRTKEELLKVGAGDNYFVNDPLEILEILK